MENHSTCQSGGSGGERKSILSQRKCCWCTETMAVPFMFQYFNYILVCFLALNYILSPFYFGLATPLCAVKPLSTLFALALQDKNPPECPRSARALLAHLPLPWWKSHDVYGSFLLDGFQIPPFFFSVLVFFSLTVCVCYWLMRWMK